MLGALALVTTLVQPGDTLSGIASSHSVSLAAVEQANPGITNPDYIYVGENIKIPGGGSSWTPSYTPSPTPSTSGGSSGASGSGGGSGYHIPGVSDSVAACIAFKESTNGQGSANVFQISNGYYPGMSLAQQEALAGQVAATQGVHNAWGVYDGCA